MIKLFTIPLLFVCSAVRAQLATEPSAQPTNLTFTSITSSSFNVGYTAATGNPAGYITIARAGSAPTEIPIDGTSYTSGATIGTSTVIYTGSEVSFAYSGLTPATTYYYAVYSYNGTGVSTNYLTTNPLQGNATTLAVPSISSFSPANGPVGTSVTITGANFSTTLASNTVYFGATKATVTGATTTQLTVTVPIGATYQPITVTVNGFTAYSSKPFILTFPGGGVIDANTFLPKVDFTTGTIPGDVTIGDVDGDGKPDLAVLNNNLVSVLRNTSVTGLITSSSFDTKVDFSAALDPNGVAFGDLNGDGKPDLAISSVTEAQVSVLRNTSVSGSVLFASKVGYYAPGVGIAIGDLNGDGKPDLATGNNSDNTVSVLRNISVSGTITSSSFAASVGFPTESVPYGVAIGDLDEDGKPDLAVAANGGNAVSVLRNTSVSSSITFASKVDYITGGSPRSVAIGDLDGDGKQDLVVANYGTNSVSVLRNTSVSGSIAFVSGINFTTGTSPDNVAIGDLDGDGKPDLALANLSSNTVSVFRNTSVPGFITSSSFASKVDFITATGLRGVAIGDVDGDGKPDLVITNGSNAVSVFRNRIDEGPTITNFTPTSGAIGATVTITGTNFSATATNNTVMFNGTVATVTASTTTSITTSVPSGATTGPITLTVNGTTGTSSTNFTVVIPPTTWHVSTVGNDTNAGTSSAPLQNIQTALTRASAGDFIKVASGTFTENLISQNVVLRGGYDATFADANRNLFINKTILNPSTGTIITDNGGSVVDGFMIDGRSGATRGIVIAAGHSTVTHNAVFGFLNGGGSGIQVSSGASAVVKNNSIAYNKLTGGGVIFYALNIQGNLNNATVVQNNITSNNDVGVHISPAGVQANYNCTFSNTYGNYSGTYGTAGSNDLSTDPRIVDPANGDFRLKGSSPCIDAGNPSDPVGDEPAPNGNRIDIGAYGGTTSATPAGSNPTTHVAISGNNSNDGSVSAPYRTIQKAISSALGDTVKVAIGTYNEGLVTGSKVILLGGYTTSFKNVDRNILSNKTIILGVSTIMLYDTKGSTIDGFIFDGNSVPTDAGIKVEVGSVVTHNIVIRVNQSFAAGIEVNGGAQVLNNTVRSCAYGIEIKSGTSTPSIKNNIVASNTRGMETSAFNSSVRKYNDVYGNSFNYTGSDSNPGTGDISLDPLFKDVAVATLDLRILSTSPCVNAGDPADFVAEEPPPNGGRIDMGAYGGTKIAPFADVPTITGFNPTSGPVGTSVIISGTNFSTTASNNTVKFNNTVANVTSSTTASITTTVPAGATTGAITVIVGGQTATSSTNFAVTVVTSPTITSFNPTSGAVGTSVIINGTNFSTTLTSNTVKFNTTTATVTASTATSITTSVPTGATTGTISVTVGGQTATSSTNFTVTTASSPTISGFNPASGNVGTSVSITGTNFSTTITNNTVKFNTTTATVTASTATSITTSVPTSATTGPITVTVGGQTATSATNFTVTTPSTTVQITNESFVTTYDKGATLAISITVNDATKVSKVNFKSRGISEAASALKSVEVPLAGNKYEKIVPATELTDPIGIAYSFEVIDQTPSQGVVNSTIGKARVRYPASSTDQVLPALSFGNQVSNYQIIAVPLELTNKNVASVFVSLMPYDKTKWRLFDYANNDNREYSAFSTIDAGKGYWLIVKTNTTINPGEGKSVQADDTAPFTINLSTGWNLIGNPYNFRVSWTDVLTANSNPAGLTSLKVFSGGTLADGTILEKYRGAFVFSNSAISIKIPVTRSLGGRTKEETDIVNTLDQNSWEVKLMLRDGQLGNELGGIGMHPNATLKGKDPFDEVSVPLPEGLNLFELAYPHPEVFTYFNKEVVPTQENYRWDFEVKTSSPARNLELSWKNDYFGDNEKQLFLFDPTTLQITDMRKVNHITLTTSTNNLSVLFGGPEYIQHALDSDLPWLGYPYPNPAKEELTIPFRVPERYDQMPVKISILNGTGVEVATPVNRTLGTGNYDVKWYPQGESGLYLIRMKIGQQETKAMKVIIK